MSVKPLDRTDSERNHRIEELVVESVDRALHRLLKEEQTGNFWLKTLSGVATAGLLSAVAMAWSSNERLTRVETNLEMQGRMVERISQAMTNMSDKDAMLPGSAAALGELRTEVRVLKERIVSIENRLSQR